MKAATAFYLVRHALKQEGAGDVPISAEGGRQAKLTAAYFRHRPIAAVVSSPLKRAVQTAAAIAEATGAPLSEDARLRERANWGDLPGQTFAQFVAMWERCTADPGYAPPVGDSARGAGERMGACLSELAAAHPGKRIVVVTHGGVMTDFLACAIAEPDLTAVHPRFAEERSRLVPECSITQASCEGGKFALGEFASVAHLVEGPGPGSTQ